MSVIGVFLFRVFQHSDVIWRFTKYVSVFGSNEGNKDQKISEYEQLEMLLSFKKLPVLVFTIKREISLIRI